MIAHIEPMITPSPMIAPPARNTSPPSPPAELPNMNGVVANMSVFMSYLPFLFRLYTRFFFGFFFFDGLFGTSGSLNGISRDGVYGIFSCEIASSMLLLCWLVL